MDTQNSTASTPRTGRSTAVTITMLPTTKVELEALSTLLQVPASRVVDQAIGALIRALDPEDRSAVERLVRRAMGKVEEAAVESPRTVRFRQGYVRSQARNSIGMRSARASAY